MRIQLLGIAVLLSGILLAMIDEGQIGIIGGFLLLVVGAFLSIVGCFRRNKE